MTAQNTLRTKVERLAPDMPTRTAVTIALGDARELLGELAMLTDMVVTAAAMDAGELSEREQEYAGEALHELAADLVAANPRLKGAYRGGA
jgi:hypothetical protein